MGSCQEVISLLTDFLITLGQTDKPVVMCLWMPVFVVSGLVYPKKKTVIYVISHCTII